MKSFGGLLTVLLLLPLSAVVVLANHDDSPSIYELHGSGTTNPSKCFWLIMQQFMDRAKLPLHLTYRAVGSSTGQAEFIGSGDKTVPANDFGSGDIPISTANYDALSQAGVEIVHLPFVLGAISVFHSIPNVPDGVGGLNLTSCLLARIFSRDIVVWDHPDILAQNPNLERRLPTANYPITVAHRLFGSSSTASLTAVSLPNATVAVVALLHYMMLLLLLSMMMCVCVCLCVFFPFGAHLFSAQKVSQCSLSWVVVGRQGGQDHYVACRHVGL